MNLVKIKDIKMTPNESFTQEQCVIFNEHFRGKYAHCIDWKYIIPLELAGVVDAINMSRQLLDNPSTDIIPSNIPYFNYDDLIDYIDLEDTERLNNITKYIAYNEYIPDGDITLEDVKPFRTWLATTVRAHRDNDASKDNTMLEYYMQEMYDDTARVLNEFIEYQAALQPTSFSCACQSVTIPTATSMCDALGMYRRAVYDFMVEKFSSIDYWLQLDIEFLLDVSKYMDVIIAYNLPLVPSSWVDIFMDCGCTDTNSQAVLMEILKNASQAFKYMANNEVFGHKNFISTSLSEWASKIYEKMRW